MKFYLETNHPHDCKTEAGGEASCWKSKKETVTFPFNGTRVGNVPNFLFWSLKPHQIDTGDEVKCKEAKVDRGVEREDEDHHHKAESCGNQLIEKREPLEWVEEESDLKKCLLTFCIWKCAHKSIILWNQRMCLESSANEKGKQSNLVSIVIANPLKLGSFVVQLS